MFMNKVLYLGEGAVACRAFGQWEMMCAYWQIELFYNRLLKCFVLIDHKIGKLTHGAIGKMRLYANY